MLFEPGSVPAGPPIETKKALILLDFQNDFLNPDGNLLVGNVQPFLPNLLSLVAEFRTKGEVIWVRTEYIQSRSSISPITGSHSILLKQHLQQQDSNEENSEYYNEPDNVRSPHEDPLSPSLKPDVTHDREAFLAPVLTTTRHRCCMPESQGAEYPDPIKFAIDPQQDLVMEKSHYSAFEDTPLLMYLRTHLITEIYVCGTLSNIGVYASVLDAVCHGLQVTLVEDCLGYLDETCHVEAMRQMADNMGANGVDCQELRDDVAGLLGDVVREEDFLRGSKSAYLHLLGQEGRILPDSRFTLGYQHSRVRTVLQEMMKEHHRSQAKKWRQDIGTPMHQTQQATRKRRPSRESSTRSLTPMKSPIHRTRSTEESPPHKTMSSGVDQERILDVVAEASPENRQTAPRKKKKATSDILGLEDKVGQGDSRLHINLLDQKEAEQAFYACRESIKWQKMFHRSGEVPRLVAVQGTVSTDGTEMPIYRHPADESPELMPFDAVVGMLRKAAEKVVGHPLNHALIQWYRNSEDNISEHSDKTLDIVRGSSIVNVSLGAQRTMVLRAKKSAVPARVDGEEQDAVRPSQRVPLPHNSLFVLGQDTNQHWLHSIRADKRPTVEKTPAELAFEGERISFTFRQIGTFINLVENTVWGQGATNKHREGAKLLLTGAEAEREGEAMIRAFGQENHRSMDWDWAEWYGKGFDVVNFETKTTEETTTTKEHQKTKGEKRKIDHDDGSPVRAGSAPF